MGCPCPRGSRLPWTWRDSRGLSEGCTPRRAQPRHTNQLRSAGQRSRDGGRVSARLRSDPDSLSILIDRASRHFAIRASYVEKDFWVTEVLRVASQPRAI